MGRRDEKEVLKVFLTRRAERNFNAIKSYITQEFGTKTDQLLILLKNYPAIGQIEKDDIRGFQLSPQTRILYRLREDKIIILAFFDVRQNPKKKFHI